MAGEADKVREALFFDPTVDDATYGRLVEEAADADERASWRAEREPEDEGPTGIAAFYSARMA